MAIQPTSQTSGLQPPTASKMKPKKNCHFEGCKKSLKLVDELLKCRCEGVFCRTHRDVIAHRCSQKGPSIASTTKATSVYESAFGEGSAF